MVQCTTVNFELILDSFCDAFWVTIRNLLDFNIEISCFFPTISCSLSPGDHDRSRFSVQFGVLLKLEAEIKMDKFPKVIRVPVRVIGTQSLTRDSESF